MLHHERIEFRYNQQANWEKRIHQVKAMGESTGQHSHKKTVPYNWIPTQRDPD